MDRAVMEGDSHSVIEGMALAGYAIGAKGLCLHPGRVSAGGTPLADRPGAGTGRGLLGKNIMGTGFDFDVEIKLGAGAFVCGEETALIHSIQGERGEPRTKPPFPAQSGLWDKPTIVNNVETLANVPAIISCGAEWYSSHRH
jgi:NADH:ubiquinone oxidoreductase subunit F (NADH-binding)